MKCTVCEQISFIPSFIVSFTAFKSSPITYFVFLKSGLWKKTGKNFRALSGDWTRTREFATFARAHIRTTRPWDRSQNSSEMRYDRAPFCSPFSKGRTLKKTKSLILYPSSDILGMWTDVSWVRWNPSIQMPPICGRFECEDRRWANDRFWISYDCSHLLDGIAKFRWLLGCPILSMYRSSSLLGVEFSTKSLSTLLGQ